MRSKDERGGPCRPRSINDPRLSRGARRLLRAALAKFAENNPHPLLGPDEHLAAVIELYEVGLLQIYGRPTSYEFLLSQHGHETARRKSNRRRDQEMPFGPRSYRFRLPTWCTRVQIGDIRGMWSWRSLQPRRPITPRRA
jgi:hypothetical protein